MDKDRNGWLSAQELQDALQNGGLAFSLSTVAHIVRIFGRSYAGYINFEEFVKLHDYMTTMSESFDHFDRDKSSSLTYEEVCGAITQVAGYQLQKSTLEALMERYDTDRSGSLDVTEFLALALYLRSATKVFNSFDEQRNGVIALNFDQFLTATSKCT